jgi:[acyl-carrier-protein] S-malonyltransferase
MFDMACTHPRGKALVDASGVRDHLDGDMFASIVAQPLIVTASLAMWAALEADLPAPSLVAGYSVGEVSAYAVAGALEPGATIAIAARRAQLMDAAMAGSPPQVLCAMGNLPVAQLAALGQSAGFHPAIITGADTCIAGGLRGQLPALFQLVLAAGGRIEELPVKVAAHTPWMAAAVAPFAAMLGASPTMPQRCPVLAGVDASRVMDKTAMVAQLSRQLSEPIVWDECMDAAQEAGITVALELGPGNGLTRMLQNRHPGIACRSVADFRSVAGVVKWVEKQMQA